MVTALQQRARGLIQNVLVIVLALALVALVYFYFFRDFATPADPVVPSEFTLVDPAPMPTDFDQGQILFQDTFAQANGAWELSVAGQAEYARGALVLDDKPFEGIALARPYLEFDNFVLAVHTRWLSGGIGGSYGVRFRLNEAGDFYAFYLSNEGRYTIGKQLQGQWFVVEQDFSPAIKRGGEINLIRLEASGSNLRFFVNDQYIGDMSNDGLGVGDIALVAEKAGNTDSFIVAFDNLVVARYATASQP